MNVAFGASNTCCKRSLDFYFRFEVRMQPLPPLRNRYLEDLKAGVSEFGKPQDCPVTSGRWLTEEVSGDAAAAGLRTQG